jgi:hypothetical protein
MALLCRSGGFTRGLTAFLPATGLTPASMQPRCGVVSCLRMPQAPRQRANRGHAAPRDELLRQRQQLHRQQRRRGTTPDAAQAVAAQDTAASPAGSGTRGNGQATSESTTDAATAAAAYASFDWRAQWYPVAFARNLPEGAVGDHFCVVWMS